MTISTPALAAIADTLAVEQLHLRNEQAAYDRIHEEHDAALLALEQRRSTVAQLEASLASLTPPTVEGDDETEPEPEGAA